MTAWANNKKTILLSFLVLVWIGLFFYLKSGPEQGHRPLKHKPGEVAPSELPMSGSGGKGGGRLALLRPAEKLEITKNIFAPIRVYIAPPPKTAALLPPVVVTPPPPSAEEIARSQAMADLSQFKYLGYLNKGGREQGFFSKGSELYIVGKGEAMEGNFILKEIDPNHAVLRDRPTGVESSLTLTN
ncbi:MAG TPA: hypothetical protein VN944_10035 [Nitrospiria bacterium]|nr:hypothetical protein [Nitrospiria bacterium]